jgi:hypothetical protein
MRSDANASPSTAPRADFATLRRPQKERDLRVNEYGSPRCRMAKHPTGSAGPSRAADHQAAIHLRNHPLASAYVFDIIAGAQLRKLNAAEFG